MWWKNILIVGAGGMLGSILRYAVSLFIKYSFTNFPLATLIVNVAGSFIIGFVFALGLKGLSQNNFLFITTGICGGFTTFSAFSLEGLILLQEERYGIFVFYFLLSIVLGLAAAFLGYWLAIKNF